MYARSKVVKSSSAVTGPLAGCWLHVTNASPCTCAAQRVTAAAQTRAMPLFMVASAAEAKPSAAVNSNVPQWQRVAANLAAGAAAGCSVEAGKGMTWLAYACCCRCGKQIQANKACQGLPRSIV